MVVSRVNDRPNGEADNRNMPEIAWSPSGNVSEWAEAVVSASREYGYEQEMEGALRRRATVDR